MSALAMVTFRAGYKLGTRHCRPEVFQEVHTGNCNVHGPPARNGWAMPDCIPNQHTMAT